MEDFEEDIIGFGHNELKAGVVVNPEQSGFFMSLGETTEQRVAALTQLTKDRLSYRKELFRALQMAWEMSVHTDMMLKKDVGFQIILKDGDMVSLVGRLEG
ncbi:hypothetical protein ANCCAN_11946 [Ancylostoma caninum]|uniref:Uncharacterized protein n=1 Tax=Ancylostoma caninum TaxID=29170 RepID=A0A368GCF8_ANCCA|nr:hypothetical protein ANCCAN_11946 [Ancylostoma caninum]